MEHTRRAPAAPRALAVLSAVAALTFAAAAVSADPATELPRTEALAVVARLSKSSEPLSVEAFAEAALVLSGVPEQELDRVSRRLRALVEEAGNLLEPVADPRDKAEGILRYLHERVLAGYDERQTRIDALLDSGGYNCVSSGVLYALLAKSLGFEVWGVRTDDHAFCGIRAGGRSFDVETTSPFGFDPGSRKEFTDSFGKVTGYTYVAASGYRRRDPIGERSLLGLILYNRAAFLSDRGSYLEAVPPAVDAYGLLGDAESRERMVVAFLNLGSSFGVNREFARGVEFLLRVEKRFPEARLTSLREDLVHNWILSLADKREFDAAEALLDDQRAGGVVSEGQWRSLTVYVYQLRAQEAARRDPAAAAGLIRQGLDKAGPDGDLHRSLAVYVHNQVVFLMRARKLVEALAVIEQALTLTPGSSLLERDRSTVTEQLRAQ